MKYVEVDHFKVAYQEAGQGDVLLLIHGFCGSSGYWDNVISELAKDNRVIAIDLPGHGKSAVQDNVNEIKEYATLMKNFLDTLEIDKVTMLGHSLGGYITLAFADKYANRLNGFSLIHSTAFPDSEEGKKGRSAAIEKIDSEGIEPFIDGLVPKLFSPTNAKSHEKEVDEAIKIGYMTSPSGAKSALIAMKNRNDLRKVLDDTSVPVLLLAGEDDQLISPERTFTATGDNIKQVVLPGVGHMSMYEAPKQLIDTIRSFV